MNIYLEIAGVLCFLLGLVHSFLGEFLIFNRKRKKGHIVPSKVGPDLRKKHLGILWATWHLASIFGWCIGAFLIKISMIEKKVNQELMDFIICTTTLTMFLASILVLVGTKGRHPGWIVLLLIGILMCIGYL